MSCLASLPVYEGDDAIFHNGEADVHPVTGDAARDLAEMAMRLAAVRKVAGPLTPPEE